MKPVLGYRRSGILKGKMLTQYHDWPLMLQMEKEANNELPVGRVLFTKAGSQLASLCPSRTIAGFYEYVMEQWKKFLPSGDAPSAV